MDVEAIVREALDGVLPGAAFSKNADGREIMHLGGVGVDYQKLCERVADDLAAAGLGQP